MSEGSVRVSFDMTQRSGYGGVPGRPGSHLAWIDVLEPAHDAWTTVLDATGRDDLRMPTFAVANIASDFRREMFRTTLDYDVTLERIGNSSLTIRLDVTQDGADTATIRVVIVRVAPGRAASAGFTSEQRAALERQMTPAAASSSISSSPSPSSSR